MCGSIFVCIVHLSRLSHLGESIIFTAEAYLFGPLLKQPLFDEFEAPSDNFLRPIAIMTSFELNQLFSTVEGIV